MIADFFIMIINFLLNLIFGVFTFIINLLPESPFKNLDLSIPSQYIGWMNWLFPFGAIINILTGWAVCVAVYFFIRWIMKIFKLA